MWAFSGLAHGAYLIYPPQVSVWIEDPNHVAELGFILLLAITASKAVGVIIDGKPLGSSAARAASRRTQPRVRPSLAVAERPAFPGAADEIDRDVFFSYAGPLVHLIGYPLIEFFLHLNGPTAKST